MKKTEEKNAPFFFFFFFFASIPRPKDTHEALEKAKVNAQQYRTPAQDFEIQAEL